MLSTVLFLKRAYMSNNRRFCHDLRNKEGGMPSSHFKTLGITLVGRDENVTSNYILVVKSGCYHVTSTFFTKQVLLPQF